MELPKEYLPGSIEAQRILLTGGTTGIGPTTAILLASQRAGVMSFGIQ